MAGDNPATLSRSSRTGSWARAFERVRAAMKRRSSSTRPREALSHDDRPSQEPTTTVYPPCTMPQIPVASGDAAKPEPLPTAPAEPSPSEPPITADKGIDADEDADNDEDDSQLPPFSTRMAFSDERARDLFSKYNLKYDPRGKRPQQESPSKIRRVEKPVRLRVHWTCHECRSQFGMEKVCAHCGHRRCRECVRHPPKRAREVVDISRQRVEEEQEPVQETAEQLRMGEEPTAVDPDLQSYREEPAAPPLPTEDASPKGTPRTSAPAATSGGLLSSRPLEIDDDADVDYANLRSNQFLMYTRPRAAIHTVLQPTAQSIRRTCHECNTPMLPSSRHNCPNCGHVKCDLCTHSPGSQHQEPGPSNQAPEEEEVPMVRAVKRVYRKPRQRVRYRCENCNTHFVESDRCVECGHERCQTCHREP